MRNHEKPLDLGVLYVQKNPCGKRWKNYGWRRGFAGDPWAAYFCDISKFYQMNSNHGFASALVEPESLKGMNSVPFGLLDPFSRPGQTCMNREGGRSWICWKHIWDQDPRGYKHRSSGPGFRRLEPKGCHKKNMRNDRTEVCHLWGSHCLGSQKRVRLLKEIHAWDGTAFAACNYEGSNKKQINNMNNKIILHSFSVMMSNAICTSAWTSTVYPWPDWRFQPYGGKKGQRWELVRTIIPGSIGYMFIWRYKSISQRIQRIVRKSGSFSMVWACQTLQEMDFLLVPLLSGVCTSQTGTPGIPKKNR